MDYPSATLVGQKLDDSTFEVVSIVIACISIPIVSIRLAIRYVKIGKFFADDFVLMFGALALVGSTVMTNLLLPYNQAEVDIGAGLIPPPDDIVHILDYDVKFQDASVFLAHVTIFSVKFSFLLFFKQLLEYTGKLRMYWWFVFLFTIPAAIVCACTEFIACPAFGDQILPTCVYSGLQRQTATLIVTTVLDIITDVMLISIPITILWGVRMNLRRKIACGWLLCLSSFCIVCVIIKGVGHYLVNGQNDVVWILFWSDMEANVGLIACSMTAFRGLFNTRGSRIARVSPFLQARSPNAQTPQLDMPAVTKPQLTGLRSIMLWDPFEEGEQGDEEYRLADRTRGLEKVGEDSFRAESVVSSNETHRNKHECSSEAAKRS